MFIKKKYCYFVSVLGTAYCLKMKYAIHLQKKMQMKKYSLESIQKTLKESGLKLKDYLVSIKVPVYKYYYEKQKHDQHAAKS